MSQNEDHIVGVHQQLKLLIGRLAYDSDRRPGSVLDVQVCLPQELSHQERNALESAVATAVDDADRHWTAGFTFMVGTPRVSIEFAAAAAERDPNLPILELVYPVGSSTSAKTRRELALDTTYALMRGSDSVPVGAVSLNVGSRSISTAPHVLFRWDGRVVLACVPPSGAPASIVVGGVPHSITNHWAPLPAESESDLVAGQLVLRIQRKVVIVHLRVLVPGSRRAAFRGVTLDDVEVVSKRRYKNQNGQEVFLKTYECETVTDAERLTAYFEAQQTLIRKVNAALREALASPEGVLRNGLEETDIRRGTAPRYDATDVVSRVVPESALETVTQPGDPPVQADHRVLVRTPLLREFEWATGRTDRLPMLVTVAASLDELHRRGAAHGDVKPSNVCLESRFPSGASTVSARWAILVDTEGLSQPNFSQLPWTGLHTPLFTHPAFRKNTADPQLNHLIANDRVGFVAVAIACLFGMRAAQSVLDSVQPGVRRNAISAAMNPAWRDEDAAHLLTLLLDPFDRDLDLLADGTAGEHVWRCAEWLGAVMGAVSQADTPSKPAPERTTDLVTRTLASARNVYANTARPRRQEALEAHFSTAAWAHASKVFRKWFWSGVCALAALFVIVLVILLFGRPTP